MALKGITPEMQAMDRAVKALNTKITKIAQTFGTDSRQYRQIEEIQSIKTETEPDDDVRKEVNA